MAVYVFSLLVGFYHSGVDSAQGKRGPMLHATGREIHQVFTDLPDENYFKRYVDAGVPAEDIMCAHMAFTDDPYSDKFMTVPDKIAEFKRLYPGAESKRNAGSVDIFYGGSRIAVIQRSPMNPDYVGCVMYFNHERLIYEEHTIHSIKYYDYFITAHTADGTPYAKQVRRVFKNSDGSVGLEIRQYQGEDRYLLPDGRYMNQVEFLTEFIKRMNFTEQDIIIQDRFALLNYVPLLYQYASRAKFACVLHSDHYFLPGQDPNCVNTNTEYLFLFNNLQYVDAFIVSTDSQKEQLADFLRRNNRPVPRIEVIPAGCVFELKHPAKDRRPGSIITVARFDPRKRNDLVIKAAIAAHSVNPHVSLDIYGGGSDEETSYLQGIIDDNGAADYVHLMGQHDLTDVYQDYEVFATASLWETLGLAMLEAVGAGVCMVGFDAKYGNLAFIEDGGNGRMLTEQDSQDLAGDLGQAIVEVLSDSEQLQRYQARSYEIAQRYTYERVSEMWKRFLDSL